MVKPPKIVKNKGTKKIVRKGTSEASKKMWADPVKRAELVQAISEGSKRRKYSKKGYRIQSESRRRLNTPEFYATRDQSYMKEPGYWERVVASRKRNKNTDPFEADFDVVEVDRINDFSGVVTKAQYEEVTA